MSPEDVRKRMRAHLVAFISILALAMVAAATALAGEANRSAVLAIAAVQVLIVLGSMMHAHRDGPWVTWLLAFCALNVAGLGGILYVGYFDTINGTEHVVVSAPANEADTATESEPGESEH